VNLLFGLFFNMHIYLRNCKHYFSVLDQYKIIIYVRFYMHEKMLNQLILVALDYIQVYNCHICNLYERRAFNKTDATTQYIDEK
jgi:hypothetical protein